MATKKSTGTQRAKPIKITFRDGKTKVTQCTPDVIRKVATLVASGNTVKQAVAAIGISWNTASKWRAYADEGKQPYVDYFEAIAEAKAACEVSMVQAVYKFGMAGDAKALQYILERRYGQRWRPPSQRQELTGKDGGPIQAKTISELTLPEVQSLLKERK